MRKTAYLLHGICYEEEYWDSSVPSLSNFHWFPWLQQKFLHEGYLCQTLEMPSPYRPTYRDWAETFEQAQLNEQSIVVAHSAGCGFFLKWMSEHRDLKIHKLILVAPWKDPFVKYPNFLEGDLDENLSERIQEIDLLYSEDEPVEGVLETKNMLCRYYPMIRTYIYKDKGHFCLSDTGPIFEDLWHIIQH